jgi:ketosteroid isomerase-like protein
MKSLLVLSSIGLISLGIAACGSTDKTAPPASVAHGLLGDGDADNPGDIDGDGYPDKDYDDDSQTVQARYYHDKDDRGTLNLGHAASTTVRGAVAAVVERYFTAAAKGDSAIACSLLRPGLAKSLPEAYAGASYLRGAKTCQTFVSLLFKRLHDRLAGTVKVTGVRVMGNQAVALLGSTTKPASDIMLAREGGSWRIEVLLDSVLE